MLLMALPNEHLLTFSQYKDGKPLFEAIQARFSGNDATKKTQRTLLKQMYENFNAPSTESLNSIFNSNATVYAFLANQPNGSQLVHEDLEQIHEDDLEEIDLKRQLALLSMRARRYFQSWEFRSLRNQESMPRNQDNSRKTVIVEDTSSKAMVAIDGDGFDWSYMADDEFNKSEFDLATYKRGLASVEEQLVFYKKNEVVFYDQIAVLKRDASFRDSKITALNLQIEKLKKEKERLRFTSYNAVAPPPTGLFAPSSVDLCNFGLKEFKQHEFKGYGPKASKIVSVDTSNEIKKAPDSLIIKYWVSDSDEDESEEMCKKQTTVANSTTKAEYIAASNCHGQCKKQTTVANSTTKAEYIAASNCHGQIIDKGEVKVCTDLVMDTQVMKGLELKGYLINDGYANLVQHADKKELAIPGQIVTGKELLNPLMAGSLPKTTLPTNAKTTSWNKFSSIMASSIICLATNQKFNFSTYILLSLVKNIEVGVPFSTYILLVEKMYPLTHFTLEQMVNDVRLEVEDETKMSLELLRLVRRQLNERYVPQ
nr:ribonuclease H-like domain-containing protein [Tanacetum cinerariifolium]